eukprot:TRINITY_DN1870_c0_g1_i1.p2 TRINITY_DN1870_c0_g1~~TRINITY_DN1870_c0_g1_i1.p2  ORF type:complete len:357 (+),score=99.87 TRINITY_DN1870_c0_g1_i1:76-1071(+)
MMGGPGAMMAPGSGALNGPYIGVIKSFVRKSGYGFIECPQVMFTYGCDAFLGIESLESFDVGSRVTFWVELSQDGKPRARALQSAGGGPKGCGGKASGYGGGGGGGKSFASGCGGKAFAGGGCGGGFGACGGKGGKAFAAQGGFAGAARSSVAASAKRSSHSEPSVGRFSGTIKSFVKKTGFGFIECDETFGQYGFDVLVDQEEIGHFSPGDQVSFVAFLNKDGKPKARSLTSAGGGRGGGGGDAKRRRMAPPEEAEGMTFYEGRLKSFVRKTGFGFIESADIQALFGGDAIVDAEVLEQAGAPVEVGMFLYFAVDVSPQGKPRAVAVRLG